MPCDAQSAHDRQAKAPYAVPHRRERPGKASCGPIDTSHGCVRAVRMGIIHRRDECSPDLPMWDDGRVVPAGSPCPVFVHLDDNDLVSLDSAFVFVQVDDIDLVGAAFAPSGSQHADMPQTACAAANRSR